MNPSPARILIVDDEKAQMQALCHSLADYNYEPVGVTSGHAALSLMQKGEFSLMLTDLKMPDMDGVSLLKEALTIDSDLVGVIMTGEGTISSAVDAMRGGAFDYILKPFKLSVILPVLSRALDVRQLRIQNVQLQQRIQNYIVEIERANKELETFSYSASHDLRAPLRSISGFLNGLEATNGHKLDDEGREDLLRVYNAVNRMEELIDDLLMLARTSIAEMVHVEVNLSAVGEEVIYTLRQASPNRNVTVSIQEGMTVRGDKRLLRIVLENLLGNAWKFTTNQSEAKIEFGCEETDGKGTFYIRDNGAGFDENYISRLFKPFHRLHGAQEFPGTGIGLATVFRIIQRHGGNISAQGAIDKGATFRFVIGDSF